MDDDNWLEILMAEAASSTVEMLPDIRRVTTMAPSESPSIAGTIESPTATVSGAFTEYCSSGIPMAEDSESTRFRESVRNMVNRLGFEPSTKVPWLAFASILVRPFLQSYPYMR